MLPGSESHRRVSSLSRMMTLLWLPVHGDQQSVLRVDVFRVGCRGRLLSASLCKRQLPSIHAPPGSCRLQPLPDDALVLGFRGPQPLRSHFSSTRGSHPKLCQSPMLGLSSPSFSLGCDLESLHWPHTPLLPVGTTPFPPSPPSLPPPQLLLRPQDSGVEASPARGAG